MAINTSPERIGRWDPDLFARFRKAKGPLRRQLQEQLLIENTPLIKILVDQLLGVGKQRARTKLGGTKGFRHIDWDDAAQAGRIAFCKAIDGFDPSKGRIAGYLRWKILYELQQIEAFEMHLARVPRGREDERAQVTLVGEQPELDRVSTEHEFLGLAEIDGITATDIAKWQESGEWPETLEQATAPARLRQRQLEALERREAWGRARQAERERLEAAQAEQQSPLDRFLDTCLRFRPHLRVARVSVESCWETFAREEGGSGELHELRAGLAARNVRPCIVAVDWLDKPLDGYAGAALAGI